MMKKNTVIVLSIVLIASFLILVRYGMQHAWGVPADYEYERAVLKAPFIDKDIDFRGATSLDAWEGIDPKEIKLFYQLMVLPWPKDSVPSVTVKAFHNKKDIYFYLSYKDDTLDEIHGGSTFPDASAIMFPLGEDVPNSTLMMGFMGRSNIWQWKANLDREFWSGKKPEARTYTDYYYPFEENETLTVMGLEHASAVNDIIATGIATLTRKNVSLVEGRGFWIDGTWHVMFRRSLTASDPEVDAAFTPGETYSIAFAVWDGASGDRGGRKSISDFVSLEAGT